MIPAIRSRCLSVRVAAPTEMEIVNILESTCQKEGLTIPRKLATRFVDANFKFYFILLSLIVII